MQKQKVEWISEVEAAAIMGLKPLYFRECVITKRKYSFGYVKPSRNQVLYNKVDIDNYLLENAVMPL